MPVPLESNKKAIILEIGDIYTDGRCRNIAKSIRAWGMEVTFVGPGDFDQLDEYDGIRVIRRKVLKSLGSKVLFIHYWIRAFWYGIQYKPSLILAEDLYSLPPAVAIKTFSRAVVLYDSKELYFALASLQQRPVTQWFWSLIERLCIRWADRVLTSGERDSDIIAERYSICRPVTIHNHPPRRTKSGDKEILRRTFGIEGFYSVFVYQGWLLQGRGLFHLITLAAAIDRIFLVIMGEGALRKDLSEYVHEKDVSHRVIFTGAIPYETMLEYTVGADVGCALIEDYGLSYQHARPNKLFEYIQAGVPVLVSDLPAMREVVDQWGVGIAVDPTNAADLQRAARRLIDDREFYEACARNCEEAAKVYHWGEEDGKLKRLLDSMVSKF